VPEVTLHSRRPGGLLLVVVMVVIAAALGLNALFGTNDGPARPSGRAPSFASARDGLCQAAAAADRSDVAGARAEFFDRAHQPLHELAGAAQTQDRAAAARLLEAKARVEADISAASPSLGVSLAALADATGQAMAAIGAGDPGPCRP